MSTTPQTSSSPRAHPCGDGQGPVRRSAARNLRRQWWGLRFAAVALVAAAILGALTAPTCAAAMVRLPDPPAPWSAPLIDVSTVVTTLVEDYPNAALTQQRRLHNDMVLEVNAPWSAI